MSLSSRANVRIGQLISSEFLSKLCQAAKRHIGEAYTAMKWFTRRSSKEDIKEESKQEKPIQNSQAEQAESMAVPSEEVPISAESSVQEEVANSLSISQPELQPEPVPEVVEAAKESVQKETGLFGRLKRGLGKTSEAFSSGVGALFLGKKEIDEDLLEDIETQMIMADIGIDASTKICADLAAKVERKELYDADALYESLQGALANLLKQSEKTLVIDETKKPYVILMVGINGAGKTTTIGKLAKRLQNENKSVMLAAGDTFRAAAVEQLQVWGERNDIPVVAQSTGSDSASVIFDAFDAASKRGVDVLIADTAGRLHSNDNLMEELKKIVRVMKKRDDTAPHEVMLVLDASTGQNAIAQAKHFQQAVGVTGITVTKLDGTAKGGVLFAISEQLGLPIRFIGVGEQLDDLRPFVAEDFVKALFDNE